MKRWQIEQILYLNSESKLVLPEPQELALHNMPGLLAKKENVFLTSVRRFFTFLLNVL